MSKATITRLFVGAVVAVIAGVALVLAAVVGALAGGVVVFGGPDVVAVNASAFSWTLIVVILVGLVAIMGGSLVALISWIGALLNTAQLADKTWFIVLLVLGLLSFGFVAMIAYIVAGPDGTRQQAVTGARASTAAGS